MIKNKILSGLEEMARDGLAKTQSGIDALIAQINILCNANDSLKKEIAENKMWEDMHRNNGA